MSVRVWKGGVMVDTLGHYNLGFNPVLDFLELYIYIYICIYIYMPLFLIGA